MQVGYGDKVRTYSTEIPNIGSILGLVDMQRVINHIETLAAQVDAKDPYASPIGPIMDSKTLEVTVFENVQQFLIFVGYESISLETFGDTFMPLENSFEFLVILFIL